jgi:flagellin-like hook-associated protein FlgL
MQGGGNLLKGTLTLTPTLTTKTSTSTTTDPALSTAIQRLPSGVRVNSTTDDEPGLTSENP